MPRVYMQYPRISKRRSFYVIASSILYTSAMGCQGDGSWSGNLGTADRAMFDSEVYPILMRDCAYNNCHGAPQRYFRVWGPGRAQLEDATDGDVSVEDQEKAASYQRALSMLFTDGSRPITESPLLLKPLEVSKGGAAHGGADVFGRNVYRSRIHPAYLVLSRWALSGGPGIGSAAAQVIGVSSVSAVGSVAAPDTMMNAAGPAAGAASTLPATGAVSAQLPPAAGAGGAP